MKRTIIIDGMKTTTRKVSDITVGELKTIIHDVISEDLGRWRETLEVLANKSLMKQIKQADEDWLAGKKGAYVSWDRVKRV